MFLFNKLIVIDLLLLLAVVFLFILQTDRWKDLVPGYATALLIFSVVTHIGYYKKKMKLY